MEKETKAKINTQNYACPSCGATPVFDPKSQTLKCPYCNSIVEVNQTSYVCEQNIDELLSNTTVWKETEVIECSNCGSREIISKGALCTNCSFCGTSNIVKTSEIVGMKPHGICTFQKTKNEVTTDVKNWVKKQIFVPNSFKKSATIESLHGVYSPAFTFDCDTSTDYDGRLGVRRSRSRIGSDGRRHSESYTEYYSISGNFKRKFDDLIIHASSNIPTKYLEDLEPFPTSDSTKYNEKLLTGYTANTYSKDGKQTWVDFQSRASGIIKQDILKGYDHSTVSYFNSKVTYSNSKFKYIMLPVYVGHHTYKNKNYNFYVNGCTGKVSGKAPKSALKIFFFVLAIVGIIGLPLLITILNFFK